MCDPSAWAIASVPAGRVGGLAGLGRQPPQPRRRQLQQVVAALARPREAQRRGPRGDRRGPRVDGDQAVAGEHGQRRVELLGRERQLVTELGDRAGRARQDRGDQPGGALVAPDVDPPTRRGRERG